MAAPLQQAEIRPKLPQPASGAADFVSSGLFAQRQQKAEIASEGHLDQALALAKSDHLDEGEIAMLARRPEAEILQALAANNRLRIHRPALRALIERGRDDPKLANFLLRREDLHLCHLRLFLHADSEQRGHLIAITCRSRLGRRRRDDFCDGFDAGKLARIELAALQHDVETLKSLLAHVLSCDLATADLIAEDKGGEVLALVTVAVGLPVENAARLLQFGFPQICKSKPAFRALIGIIGRVPQPAAAHIIAALIGERCALAA